MRSRARVAAGFGRSVTGWTGFTTALACALVLVAFLGIGASAALADNAPSISNEEATEIGVTTVKLTGKVNPNGASGEPSNTTWRIQYRAVGSEEWNQANEGGIFEPESEAAAPVTVETLLGFGGELKAGGEYQFRIVAENGAGTVRTPTPVSFAMDAPNPPALTDEAATAVGYTKATLHGTLNPEGGNVNAIGEEVLPIQWQLQYSADPLVEGWSTAGEGFVEGEAAKGEGPSGDIPLEAEIPSGALKGGQTYKTRLHVFYASVPGGPQPIEASSGEGEFTTEAVATPVVGTPQASVITDTAAHLSGTVEVADADEAFSASCRFEYLTQKAFEENGNAFPEPGGAPSVPCSPNPVTGSEAQPVTVQAEATGLEPNTTYHLRLVAANAGGQGAAPAAATFATEGVPPTIGPDVSTPGEAGEATIRAYVNPHNSSVTECHFEYGLTEAYGQSAACEGDPNGPGVVETVPGPPARVSADLSGLTPGATYHFRLVATNAAGTTNQTDQAVKVLAAEEEPSCPNAGRPGTGFLPDCRAWEMVSPPDKNGNDVIVNTTRFRAAGDGSALSFSSLGAFGDAIGTAVATEYLSVRSAGSSPGNNGWATHAITPPQQPLSVNLVAAEPRYEGELSADFNRGVFRAFSPLTDVPDVANVSNLYVRTDLRSPGAGSYQLVTSCPLCATAGPLPEMSFALQAPLLGGASADFSHIALESRLNLDEGPSGSGSRAYEWDEGQLRYTGYVPAGSDISCGGSGPACVAAGFSYLGNGIGTANPASRPVNVISNDGSRVFFTVPTNESGTPFAFARSGRVYVRTEGTTTDEISASERTDCAGNPGCGGDGIPDPAPDQYAVSRYWGASVDGSRVFFTTTRALTDDAKVNGDSKLYMYDTTRPASDPNNLTLINVDREPTDQQNGVRTVMVISEDGHYVYFTANGQLVPGEPVLGVERGFYMWHDGEVAYIGQSRFGDTAENATTNAPYEFTPPQVRTTPDGRFLLLSSQDGGGFSPGYDHGNTRQFYLYSAETNTLACASCDPGGVPPKTDASNGISLNATANTTAHLNRAITDNGRYVFFTSGEALLPEDTNGAEDAYQYDTKAGRVRLLSSGTDPSPSFFVEASADGSDAFFVTRERLSAWDTDTSRDVYNARVGGGFPEPPPPPPICNGDSCKPSAPAPPGAGPSTSASFSGPGDPQIRRCPKGRRAVKVKGKRRCVKPHKHRNRNANRNRRNGR